MSGTYCERHGNVKPCPFEVADEWWVREMVQELAVGTDLPHRRGTCASCDEARRRTQPVTEQLPLGAASVRP